MTGPEAGLVANVSPAADSRLFIAGGFVAVAVGFLFGALIPWRSLRRPVPQPVGEAVVGEPPQAESPGSWPGPPPEAPPPSASR